MVFSSAVPIEPPSCWPVLTDAEATPVSCGRTPYVPVLNAVENISPMPRPVTMIGPRMSVAYPEWGPIRVSQGIPAAARTRRAETIGLGPMRGISTMLDTLDDVATPAIIGRNARPVITGE